MQRNTLSLSKLMIVPAFSVVAAAYLHWCYGSPAHTAHLIFMLLRCAWPPVDAGLTRSTRSDTTLELVSARATEDLLNMLMASRCMHASCDSAASIVHACADVAWLRTLILQPAAARANYSVTVVTAAVIRSIG
jgi:hypothetical protein